MIGFLRKWCGNGTYKIIQRLEELYERIEGVFSGIDLPRLVANIDLIAHHLAELKQIKLPADNPTITDTASAEIANTPLNGVVPEGIDSTLVPPPEVPTSASSTATDIVPNASAAPNAVIPSTPRSESKSESNATTANSVSLIDAFFSGKEQVIKDEVREYMLANYNITSLDDKLEGKMYDYMVDAIWNLVVKKYISFEN